MTSCPLVRRTRAILRNAEFGFFGVRVVTCRQTPRRCGQALNAFDLLFFAFSSRPKRTSWLIVGITNSCFLIFSIELIKDLTYIKDL